MKKRKKGRKFSREKAQRKALMKTLAVSLILKERIKTTEAKAKSLASFIEKHITRARKIVPVLNQEEDKKDKKDKKEKKAVVKRNGIELAGIRYLADIYPPQVINKLINEIAPRYKERKGGYTRIMKLGKRRSDASEMAIIEFVK
jgi:large subunit ribosomal protein L17